MGEFARHATESTGAVLGGSRGQRNSDAKFWARRASNKQDDDNEIDFQGFDGDAVPYLAGPARPFDRTRGVSGGGMLVGA